MKAGDLKGSGSSGLTHHQLALRLVVLRVSVGRRSPFAVNSVAVAQSEINVDPQLFDFVRSWECDMVAVNC